MATRGSSPQASAAPAPAPAPAPTSPRAAATAATTDKPKAEAKPAAKPAAKARAGAVLLCGTDLWDWVGRKSSTAAKQIDFPSHEFPEPNRYGAWDYIKAVDVFTHCTAAHAVIIDENGAAYTVGRNKNGQLGDGTTTSRSEPFKVVLKDERFVKAAVGKAHTILLAASGRVYAAGENKCLQLGINSSADHPTFSQIMSVKGQKFVSVACGLDFTLALTAEKGTVFSWGNPQYGQLGDGSDHSYIAGTNKLVNQPQSPKPITKLDGKNIVSIACGTNHSLAVDDTGALYAWGAGGYGRLGTNDMPPKDLFVPTEVMGFKDRNNFVKQVACGPTCCMAIDGRDALHLWGKWKHTGDGGQGMPWNYPKYYNGLSGWNVADISAGGVTLFALADGKCISWGQSAAHGELGHGAKEPRSATEAAIVKPLEGITTLKVACGLGFVLLIVDRSAPKFASLPVIGVSALSVCTTARIRTCSPP
ncbi:regulator of chromosome condensation 1/beta-lactamase-inhibitor protein II [Entophlyctis helioformis]|nr:regulator of chromosome condensation 1/beta-lactamase-inhibitor protein II [Entophlyctis helioformis]